MMMTDQKNLVGRGEERSADPLGKRDAEPFIAAMLDRKLGGRTRSPYRVVAVDQLTVKLQAFIDRRLPGARVSELVRMGGGGSKEQFRFALSDAGERDGDYVLRMDPFEGVVETSREREAEILRAMRGRVPVPDATWLDPDGAELGRPSIIMSFERGVIKPTAMASGNVTGTGLVFGAEWRKKLAPQFIDILSAIHQFDWNAAGLKHFDGPGDDPQQPARWQVEWWSRVWREDKVASSPIATLAETWMRDNLPSCPHPVLVHGDYRSGNFLFDEASAQISAFLDWELAHIGDPHEDIAWALQTGSVDDGVYYSSGLLTRKDFIAEYERASGLKVNPRTLHFYELFAAYKCLVIIWATGPRVARLQYSHQDVLLTWMAAIGHFYHSELCRLLREVPQ
jgi:aminoglycoside phosphotransferase (APT) family kinase protein